MADRRISDFPTLQQALDTDLILVDSQSSTYNISFATLKAATKGAPGTGIASYQDYYARNNSTTAPADSAFSTTVISPTSTYRYLWGYTKILYSDETELVTNKHILAVYGDKGTNLSGITTYFLAHANKTGVTRSTSGWSTTVPELTTAKPYMWSYQRLGLSDGSYQYTTPGVIGSIGQQGPQGESAYSIAVEHGYEGTEEQWEQDMADSGTNAGIASQKAQEAATSASNAASAAQSAVNSALVNYYNKTNVDNLLSAKADTSTVNTQLAAKANASDVYTKLEVGAFDYIANGTEDDVELRGDLSVSGDVSFGGDLTVEGAASFGSIESDKYHAGDTFATSGAVPFPGLVTTSTTQINLTIPVDKSLEGVGTIQVTRLIGGVRGISGYVNASNDSTDWLTTSGMSVTAYRNSNYLVVIRITKSSTLSNVTNNTPVVMFANVTLAFS